jgi:FtsH-binding integral membrane protein
MLRRALRVVCWIAAASASAVTALALWGVINPHPNQGLEAAVGILWPAIAVTVAFLVCGFALRERRQGYVSIPPIPGIRSPLKCSLD